LIQDSVAIRVSIRKIGLFVAYRGCHPDRLNKQNNFTHLALNQHFYHYTTQGSLWIQTTPLIILQKSFPFFQTSQNERPSRKNGSVPSKNPASPLWTGYFS